MVVDENVCELKLTLTHVLHHSLSITNTLGIACQVSCSGDSKVLVSGESWRHVSLSVNAHSRSHEH